MAPGTRLPKEQWPLHLKATTLCSLEAVCEMEVEDEGCKLFFIECLKFFDPSTFGECITSRTIKSTRLSVLDVDACVEKGKFGLAPHISEPLARGQHAVNAFDLAELKERRRVITESLLNGALTKDDLPTTKHPSRIHKRQVLRTKKYMFQIDFDAFYDSIPLPENVRECFIVKKGNRYYVLLTLPTGARWSVCVGQSITWVLMNFPTLVTMFSMIDNILVAAEVGQESSFVETVRTLCRRIQRANLQTSPPTQEILCMSDEELLVFASGENTFLGETFLWTGAERVVKNSLKTIAKLTVALPKQQFTYRTFVSLVSLILYATHTIAFNVANLFHLMKAYRGVCSFVAESGDWDDHMAFLSDRARRELESVGALLLKNEFHTIQPHQEVSYQEADYDDIIVIDASVTGWGAIHKRQNENKTTLYQKMWINNIGQEITYKEGGETKYFTAKHSAFAEPSAILVLLQHLVSLQRLGRKVAVVTDHFAIVQAQRKRNGYGGIGRGEALNSLYAFCNSIPHSVFFFYISGPQNPADHASRNFMEASERVYESDISIALPFLDQTFSPLCEPEEKLQRWMR